MSGTSQNISSNDPYAPQISPRVYFDEKVNFAGFLLGSIFYGKLVHAHVYLCSPFLSDLLF